MSESQGEIDGTGYQTLHSRNLDRIGTGEFSSKVVVDPPSQARARDEQRSRTDGGGPATPRQQEGTGQNGKGAEQKAPVHILFEDEPSDCHGGEAFEIEQQGRG